jgi:hypothetical protein
MAPLKELTVCIQLYLERALENVSPFSLVQESTIIYPMLQMKLWVRRQGRRWLR